MNNYEYIPKSNYIHISNFYAENFISQKFHKFSAKENLFRKNNQYLLLHKSFLINANIDKNNIQILFFPYKKLSKKI